MPMFEVQTAELKRVGRVGDLGKVHAHSRLCSAAAAFGPTDRPICFEMTFSLSLPNDDGR